MRRARRRRGLRRGGRGHHRHRGRRRLGRSSRGPRHRGGRRPGRNRHAPRHRVGRRLGRGKRRAERLTAEPRCGDVGLMGCRDRVRCLPAATFDGASPATHGGRKATRRRHASSTPRARLASIIKMAGRRSTAGCGSAAVYGGRRALQVAAKGASRGRPGAGWRGSRQGCAVWLGLCGRVPAGAAGSGLRGWVRAVRSVKAARSGAPAWPGDGRPLWRAGHRVGERCPGSLPSCIRPRAVALAAAAIRSTPNNRFSPKWTPHTAPMSNDNQCSGRRNTTTCSPT